MATHQTLDVTGAGSITSLLTTELNALAAGAGSALGTEFDNSTNLLIFGSFQLDVTFAVNPIVDTTVDLYLIPAPDGTNYNNGSASIQPQNFAIGSFNIRAASTQQLLYLWGVQLPPTKFKMIGFNGTDQPFPASGSTVKMISYGLKST